MGVYFVKVVGVVAIAEVRVDPVFIVIVPEPPITPSQVSTSSLILPQYPLLVSKNAHFQMRESVQL